MKIKVCGMKNKTNLEGLVKLSPDFIGFIFYPKSPRYVEGALEPESLALVPGHIKKVGVFVNATFNQVKDAIVKYGLDMVQLHGDESPEMCTMIKQCGVQIIKVFRIDNDFDFSRTINYQNCCDYFLFDTETKAYGGSGKKFDWTMLKNYNKVRPVFLSGGIGPDDAEQVNSISDIDIFAIDINSKFEIEPGLKDLDKVEGFINAIKSPPAPRRGM